MPKNKQRNAQQIFFSKSVQSFLKLGIFLAGVGSSGFVAAATVEEVISHYGTLAHTMYGDSLSTARSLDAAIDSLIETPSQETFEAAKSAWLASRVPYGQTEAYRFGNANVDDWEGQVNAWPLDEGLLDYVDGSYEAEDGNDFATANIISGSELINAELLRSFHEKGGSEANVATGYHAIEFLLWGQDLNKKPADAGLRPWTDYAQNGECTNGSCERRGAYLKATSELLVSDLEDIVADWVPGESNYRAELESGNPNEALRRMFFGMGSLSLGELAGERLNVALLANSQEDEHSCFSDNTHIDIQTNANSIRNIYLGEYTKVDGTKITGPSVSALVSKSDSDTHETLQTQLEATREKIDALVEAAADGEPFDQQIVESNAAGNAKVQAVINALRAQTGSIEKAAQAIGIINLQPETSDSFAQN